MASMRRFSETLSTDEESQCTEIYMAMDCMTCLCECAQGHISSDAKCTIKRVVDLMTTVLTQMFFAHAGQFPDSEAVKHLRDSAQLHANPGALPQAKPQAKPRAKPEAQLQVLMNVKPRVLAHACDDLAYMQDIDE